MQARLGKFIYIRRRCNKNCIHSYVSIYIHYIISCLLFSIRSDAPPLSTGTLKKTGLSKDITEHRRSKLVLVDQIGEQIFIDPWVQKVGPLYKDSHSPNHVQLLLPRCHGINTKLDLSYWSLDLHLGYGHRPLKVL